MDDIKELLDIASKSDNLTDCDLDRFLREMGFSEDDLSQRILLDDLYLFYSCWHYAKYKKLAHRNLFTAGSVVAKMYRIRQRPKIKDKNRPEYKVWGLKCSKGMKDSFLKFMERSDSWQKKLKRLQNAKKGHKARLVNKREAKQFETLAVTPASTKDFSQK